MIDALRYETVRVRTIGSTYWTLIIGLGLCALIAFGFGVDSRGTDLPPAAATLLLTGGGESLPFLVLGLPVALLGVLSTAHEYRYKTIFPTLTAIPRRSVALAAKVVVVGSVAAATALVSVVLCWSIGSIASGEPLPIVGEPIPVVLLGYILLVILYAVLGVALGQLTRAIPTATVIILVCPLVIEPVISALSGLGALSWLGGAVPYLPFGAGMRLLSAGLTPASAELLGRWEGGAVFAVFVGILLGLGGFLLERRDA
jgi:ABC-type transport system involved in multi-copper enzyme maturation permease subunit